VTPMLLAEFDFPIELLFVLVAGVITLLNKVWEKTKKAREESIRQEKAREKREHVVFQEVPGGVRKPAPPAPPRVDVVRKKRVAAPKGVGGATHTGPTGPQRQFQRKSPRPPHREAQPHSVAPKPVTAQVDEHYARRVIRVHPVVSRIRSNPNALRQAILLREIFGPPIAMRGVRRPGDAF